MLENRRIAAVTQEHRFALGLADPRMVEIDVDHRLADHIAVHFPLAEPDQERPALLDRRDVTGIPAVVVQEQVLVLVEPQQRDRLEIAARVPAEEDRILTLRVGEFGREDQDVVDVVAELRRVPGSDPAGPCARCCPAIRTCVTSGSPAAS